LNIILQSTPLSSKLSFSFFTICKL
jgi:hypothetical protein